METVHSPKIDCADVIDNGILIYFEDGETAFYSAYLLHATLSQAVKIEAPNTNEEEAAF